MSGSTLRTRARLERQRRREAEARARAELVRQFTAHSTSAAESTAGQRASAVAAVAAGRLQSAGALPRAVKRRLEVVAQEAGTTTDARAAARLEERLVEAAIEVETVAATRDAIAEVLGGGHFGAEASVEESPSGDLRLTFRAGDGKAVRATVSAVADETAAGLSLDFADAGIEAVVTDDGVQRTVCEAEEAIADAAADRLRSAGLDVDAPVSDGQRSRWRPRRAEARRGRVQGAGS